MLNFEGKNNTHYVYCDIQFFPHPHIMYPVNVRKQKSNDGNWDRCAAQETTDDRWQEVKRVLPARADK